MITRRTEYRLRKAKDRDHIVEGLIRALDMIDAIIALIRASEDTDAARQGLMAKPFEFSEIQANHILDMQLRRLAQLEQQKLKDEHDELLETINELESILQSDAKLRAVIKNELAEVRDEFAEPRRTQITLDAGELADLDFIEDEEVVVVLSHKGYVKTVDVRRVPQAGPRRTWCPRLEPARTRTTSSTSSPPPRTRTCCSSPTAVGSTGSGRTRSR